MGWNTQWLSLHACLMSQTPFWSNCSSFHQRPLRRVFCHIPWPSSSVTSHLFHPSLGHDQLFVFRVSEPVPTVSTQLDLREVSSRSVSRSERVRPDRFFKQKQTSTDGPNTQVTHDSIYWHTISLAPVFPWFSRYSFLKQYISLHEMSHFGSGLRQSTVLSVEN